MKNLILLLTLFLFPAAGFAQTYHTADKAALRAFLSQPSAIAGQTNGERLGLTPADTIGWTTNEDWVEKVAYLTWTWWDSESPKRIYRIDWGWYPTKKDLAGNLDLSGCTELLYLECDNNQLTSLNVSTNTKLEALWCYSNRLTSLDIRANTELTELICYHNRLTTLDVSKNTALRDLRCWYNQLTTLDVSKNTALTFFECNYNQLTSLDVSANTALTNFGCSDNQLTSLDISANTALTYLYCYNNPLTDVTVGWARPPQMEGLSVPEDVSATTLHVPDGSKALYQVADVWKEFGRILEAGETGIQAIPPTFEVYASDGSIYINSPVPEQIDVYSIGGALLYRTTKPAGGATINTTRFPQGVLIVRGSSGWVKKIAQ